KEEVQQLQQPQQGPPVVPAWFEPDATSTPKRAKVQAVRPSARRSRRSILMVVGPASTPSSDSSIYDEDEFDFVDRPPSPSTDASCSSEKDVFGFDDDEADSAPPSTSSQPPPSSVRRSGRRRPRSSDELDSEDFWRVDEEFWRKVHSKRTKYLEAKREKEERIEAKDRNAPEDDMQQGPAPVVATPRPSSLTPLDLASESLKTSDALGGFIDGDGRKLSKGVWTTSTGRVCADLATAWKGMAVQLGIRRAAIQKGAARALPRMRDVVSGCRAHARQHEEFNAASTAVVEGYQALCELAKLFASEVAKALKETRTRVLYTQELKDANAVFKAAAAKVLTEIRTWRARRFLAARVSTVPRRRRGTVVRRDR
ncbi:hypothetical protein PRIPAC_89814, partial [Pristionchus pacificus]|uniref:Uncharacterized protein n=1 Tax=Pristionchus pacificus TaxID=54126 RepID=A0A2A6CYA0_PRIPA